MAGTGQRSSEQPAVLPELVRQLPLEDARSLTEVLQQLGARAQHALGRDFVGLYLTGSFALGVGDLHSDVDFLVATAGGVTDAAESRLREVHRALPDLPSHWARVLEGAYAPLPDLVERADPDRTWLYVDNGQRDMDWSAHDNTEVVRWVLGNGALSVLGPPADALRCRVSVPALRAEAVALAHRRRRDERADPDYLANAWGQPHEVLTQCRMLYTASTGRVAGKVAAARWCLGVLPEQWHDLVGRAVLDRPDPLVRATQLADPRLTALTRRFIADMTPRITSAAAAVLTPADDRDATR